MFIIKAVAQFIFCRSAVFDLDEHRQLCFSTKAAFCTLGFNQ